MTALTDNPAAAEIAKLNRVLDELTTENNDLRLALQTTSEHGDFIEAQLVDTNLKLQAEIAERKRAENSLRLVMETLSLQKRDLEILIQVVTEHGDLIDAQWDGKLSEARALVGIDPLTRLPNRRGLDEYFQQAWLRMGQLKGPLALICIDIDHFKLYNDHYGHLVGDECLIRVARTLNEALAPAVGMVARNGGEEFAAVLPGLSLEAALEVAERLRHRVALLDIPHSRSETAPHVTVSLGVAVTESASGTEPEGLFTEADRLLYRAKALGRNRVAA